MDAAERLQQASMQASELTLYLEALAALAANQGDAITLSADELWILFHAGAERAASLSQTLA